LEFPGAWEAEGLGIANCRLEIANCKMKNEKCKMNMDVHDWQDHPRRILPPILSILFILLRLMRSEGEQHAAEEAVLLCAVVGMLSREVERVERLASKSAVGIARRRGERQVGDGGRGV
jgi:hypothetical protein